MPRSASWHLRPSTTYATTSARRWGPRTRTRTQTLAKVGFYFAFLHHYTRWLSFIALPSIATLAIQVRGSPEPSP